MILLTGGTGFIGRNILEQSHLDLIAPAHKELDLTCATSVKDYLRAVKPKAIIHCASNDKDICLYDNLRMFHNLAESGIPMITFCTGREIEDRSYKNGEYVLSKYTTKELALRKYNHIAVIQLWGCFGKHEKSIRFFTGNMLRVKQGLPILVEEDRLFSYVYVNDVVRYIEKIVVANAFFGLRKYISYTKTFTEYAVILKKVTGAKKIIVNNINDYHSYVGQASCELNHTPIEKALSEMWKVVRSTKS